MLQNKRLKVFKRALRRFCLQNLTLDDKIKLLLAD